MRVYSGSQLAPTPHTRDISRDQLGGVLSSVRDTLDSVKENVRRYVNKSREENLEDIPEVSIFCFWQLICNVKLSTSATYVGPSEAGPKES